MYMHTHKSEYSFVVNRLFERDALIGRQKRKTRRRETQFYERAPEVRVCSENNRARRQVAYETRRRETRKATRPRRTAALNVARCCVILINATAA